MRGFALLLWVGSRSFFPGGKLDKISQWQNNQAHASEDAHVGVTLSWHIHIQASAVFLSVSKVFYQVACWLVSPVPRAEFAIDCDGCSVLGSL